MYLIAGLGNPGLQYEGTRHNVGFMLLDYYARKENAVFSESKWKAAIAKTMIGRETILLIKPQTFMNHSGDSVAAAANFYKIPAEKILIAHDDLDMALGRIKIVAGGGDGGHKGSRSVIECLGTNDFPRLKIGIGRPAEPIPPERFVLGRFEPGELEILSARLPIAAAGIKIIVEQGIAAAMNRVNQKE